MIGVALRQAKGRGQSLAEFAIALPIIVFLLLGILDLGRGVFAFNTLSESARQANRLAIVDQDVTRVQAEAVAYAPTLGLTAADIDVCFKTADPQDADCADPTDDECGTDAARQLGCLAIVTSSTTFQPITPIVNAFVPSITLSSTSVGPIEYVCPRGGSTTCP